MARGSFKLPLREITARARRSEGRGDQTDELGGRILAAGDISSFMRMTGIAGRLCLDGHE